MVGTQPGCRSSSLRHSGRCPFPAGPPDITFDATVEIHKAHLTLAIEATLDLQGWWKELQHPIDCCDDSGDIQRISGWPPLPWASEHGNVERVTLLLLCGGLRPSTAKRAAEINPRDAENGRTALSLAASRGYDDIVRLLLKHVADVNLEDKARRTALLYAAEEGHKAAVRLLFQDAAASGNHVAIS